MGDNGEQSSGQGDQRLVMITDGERGRRGWGRSVVVEMKCGGSWERSDNET